MAISKYTMQFYTNNTVHLCPQLFRLTGGAILCEVVLQKCWKVMARSHAK